MRNTNNSSAKNNIYEKCIQTAVKIQSLPEIQICCQQNKKFCGIISSQSFQFFNSLISNSLLFVLSRHNEREGQIGFAETQSGRTTKVRNFHSQKKLLSLTTRKHTQVRTCLKTFFLFSNFHGRFILDSLKASSITQKRVEGLEQKKSF